MRLRFLISVLISVFILLAVVLTIIFWLRPKQSKSVLTPSRTSVQSPNPTVANTSVHSQNISNGLSQPTPSTIQKSSLAVNLKSPEDVKRYIESQNVSIEFYGKVIDQDSNALAGAKIKIGIRHWTMPNPAVSLAGSKEIYLEQTSDVDGHFEFHGATGDGFGVGVTKEGYELEPNRYGFGPTVGSYNSPVIFKMWSTNIHEQLITGNKSFDIVPDGRPYFINLTGGSISERGSGDLKVWIQYTNQVVQGQLYDWSAGIEVINGGLLEVPQAAMNSGFTPDLPFAMYTAPTDGYTPSFSLKDQIKGGQSGEIGNRYFYLFLNNGKEYGRMSINLFAPYGRLHPGLIRLSYAINPSGSRILR